MRISFTGDILCYASQIALMKKSRSQYDFSRIFDKVVPYLRNSEYLCGSLETPIADASYTDKDSSINFNTPVEFLQALYDAGFKMMTTANNHCLDRGIKGLRNTIQALEYYKLEHVGTYLSKEDSDSCFIKDFNGFKVSFLSFTYGTNSRVNRNYLSENESYMVDLLRRQDRFVPVRRSLLRKALRRIIRKKKVKKGALQDSVSASEIVNTVNERYIERFKWKIQKAKANSDVVILCMHSGGQFNFNLGIGEYTKYIVDMAVENGVDIVIGNHTHCVMPAERQDGKFISYALGNFSFVPGEGYYVENVYADYSILLHLDFNVSTKSLEQITFSVLKSVVGEDGVSQVYNVYDLYKEERDSAVKQELALDVKAVIDKFKCSSITSAMPVLKEYRF